MIALERLNQGEPLESCLKDYPEEAEELRLMLKAAGVIKQYSGKIKLRPEFVTQTQTILEEAFERKQHSWFVRIAEVFRPTRRFAFVTSFILAVLAVLFSGGFTVSVLASENTMPGEALYPVKLTTEKIKTAFAFSSERKVRYLARFAEIRAEEIVYAAGNGNIEHMEASLERLEIHLAEVEEMYARHKPNHGNSVSPSVSSRFQRIERVVQTSSDRAGQKLEKIPGYDPDKKSKNH